MVARIGGNHLIDPCQRAIEVALPHELSDDQRQVLELVRQEPRSLYELVELMKNSKEVLQCYHVTGAYTFLIKVSCGSMPQLEHLILQFQKLGTTSTQIILSTPVNHGDLEAMML